MPLSVQLRKPTPIALLTTNTDASKDFSAHRAARHRVLTFLSQWQAFELPTNQQKLLDRYAQALTLHAGHGCPRPIPGTQFGAPLCIALPDLVECRDRSRSKCPPIADVGSANRVQRRDNMTRIGDHRRQNVGPCLLTSARPCTRTVRTQHSSKPLRIAVKRPYGFTQLAHVRAVMDRTRGGTAAGGKRAESERYDDPSCPPHGP